MNTYQPLFGAGLGFTAIRWNDPAYSIMYALVFRFAEQPQTLIRLYRVVESAKNAVAGLRSRFGADLERELSDHFGLSNDLAEQVTVEAHDLGLDGYEFGEEATC